jgi:hypothetical protein
MFQSAQSGGPLLELSLFVVGLKYDNADKSSRRFEAALCAPGDPVALVREPKNRFDRRAVAVLSERGVQLGYLSAERCGWIGGKIAAGDELTAVFQEHRGDIAIIRVRFGGGEPTLPAQGEPSAPSDFYTDPSAPEWGA